MCVSLGSHMMDCLIKLKTMSEFFHCVCPLWIEGKIDCSFKTTSSGPFISYFIWTRLRFSSTENVETGISRSAYSHTRFFFYFDQMMVQMVLCIATVAVDFQKMNWCFLFPERICVYHFLYCLYNFNWFKKTKALSSRMLHITVFNIFSIQPYFWILWKMSLHPQREEKKLYFACLIFLIFNNT